MVRLPACAVLLGLTLAAACSRSVPPGILLTFQPEDGAPTPEYLQVTWIGEEGAIFEGQRVPQEGPLRGPRPSLHIETDLSAPEERVVIARGFIGSDVVVEAATRFLVSPGERSEIALVLVSGRLPDRDGDGMPDPVDLCPGLAGDRLGGCPASGQAQPDAGAPDAEPIGDAAVPDAAPDSAGGPDALDAAAVDALPDAAGDGAPLCATADPSVRLWDFEDGSINTFAFGATVPGKTAWAKISDGTAGMHTMKIEPAADRCDSRALHYTATGFSAWGSGVGSPFLPSASGDQYHDASAFTGIRFLARATTPTYVIFKIPDRISRAMGPHVEVAFTVGTTWREHVIAFSALKRKTGVPLAVGALYGVEFLVAPKGAPGLWIDDIAFVK